MLGGEARELTLFPYALTPAQVAELHALWELAASWTCGPNMLPHFLLAPFPRSLPLFPLHPLVLSGSNSGHKETHKGARPRRHSLRARVSSWDRAVSRLRGPRLLLRTVFLIC